MTEYSKLTFSETLASRIFHELAGSTSILVGMVDYAKENPPENEEEFIEKMDSINKCAERFIDRFRLLQQAYSFSESSYSIKDACTLISNYFADKGVTFTFFFEEEIKSPLTLVSACTKIITNMSILCFLCVSQFEKAKVVLSKKNGLINIEINCFGKSVSFEKAKKNKLQSLDIKNVHLEFLNEVLKKYNAQKDVEGEVLSMKSEDHGLKMIACFQEEQ